jgi:hypothetical protein
VIDWRLPENRREAFIRFYSFHLKYKSHPGCVYALLPAIAKDFDWEQRAWLVWLNGNTQNAVTSMLLLEAAPRPQEWKRAVDFWNEHFRELEWDTDRRHQKSRFGQATEAWATEWADRDWPTDWSSAWAFAKGQPYMGRLSAWSMLEYARILLPGVPDAAEWLLEDKQGSQSHRNGLALVKGYDSVYWEPEVADMMGIVEELATFGDDLLAEARERNPGNPDVGRLTMESALCTYKSWHKPNRRYPNVYADMMYNRIRKAEARFGPRFELLWETRRQHLPEHLRLEDNPLDPGLCPEKQNHYLLTGEPIMMHRDYPDMYSSFNQSLDLL